MEIKYDTKLYAIVYCSPYEPESIESVFTTKAEVQAHVSEFHEIRELDLWDALSHYIEYY